MCRSFRTHSIKHIAMLIILLLAVGCSNQTQPTSLAPASNPLRWLAKEGNPAPDFTLESLTGQTIDSSQYRGRPILVHFWATWCQPCRDEVKRLEAAEKSYRSKGFEILALTNETDRDEVAKFAREQNLSFPILFDPNNTVFDAYRVTGIPTSFLVDVNGIIRQVVSGSFTTSSLDLALGQILSSDSSQ